jgi:hypothetical protein
MAPNKDEVDTKITKAPLANDTTGEGGWDAKILLDVALLGYMFWRQIAGCVAKY